MFCDTCHWYTAGEKICPHCGAEQKPKAAKDMFHLPGDVSILDDTFMDKPLAGMPKPAPVPKAEPIAKPVPAPKPVPQAPLPVPKPAPVSAPRPAPPPPGNNKQGIKALAIVLAGVFALILVLVIADQAGQEVSYINQYDYNYDDWYDDVQAEPSLEDAQPGDVIPFGNMQWLVLDQDLSGDLLLMLLLEEEMYLRPEEIDEYPGEKEYYGDVAYWGGAEFGIMEYHRILRMFLLSAEEMAEYGIEPSEAWNELVPVRPAIWVNTRL